MSEVTIDSVQTNYDHILELLGQESFVNWDTFTKSSTGLNKEIEELAKKLTIYRDIQHKRFISTMKSLKGYDIPDLIKTVKAKKLPKEALKTILSKFTLNGDKLELVDTKQKLKQDSSNIFEQYYNNNLALTNKIKDTSALLQQRIQTSGLYNTEPEYNAQPLVSTFKHNFDEAKLEAVSGSIQLEYLPGTVDTIHIKTYAKIVQASLEIIKSEFKRLTQEARIKQRNIMKQPAKYIASLIEYLSNTEVLIIDGQKSIYAKLGVTVEKMEQSENSLMEKGLAQNLLLIQSALRTKVKQSMVPQKQASLEQAKQILRFQVNQLKTRITFFKQLFSHLQKTAQNYQLIPMLLALTLNDIVFDKYTLQQEDFMKNVNDTVIMTNLEVTSIFRDMELAIIKLMEQLQIISPEASNMMLNQSQMPLQQTGLPPGSNPMDLLQMQQMQQMQQMAQFQQMQKLYIYQQQQQGNK